MTGGEITIGIFKNGDNEIYIRIWRRNYQTAIGHSDFVVERSSAIGIIFRHGRKRRTGTCKGGTIGGCPSGNGATHLRWRHGSRLRTERYHRRK